MERRSKLLSKVLRYRAPALGVPVHHGNWVRVHDLLANAKFARWTERDVMALVRESRFAGETPRFELAADGGGALYVRAAYKCGIDPRRQLPPVPLQPVPAESEEGGQEGGQEAPAEPPSLSALCVGLVAEHIREVDDLGWLDNFSRQLLLARLRELGRLSSATVRPFLGEPLEALDLSQLVVGEALVRRVAQRCPQLRELRLARASVVNNELAALLAKRLPRLRVLGLEGARLSDPGLRALARCCPELEELDLRNCAAVDAEALEPLRALRRLRVLLHPAASRIVPPVNRRS